MILESMQLLFVAVTGFKQRLIALANGLKLARESLQLSIELQVFSFACRDAGVQFV